MRSFTLIELLITTAIIFVFSGLSLAYYNNFTQQQTLKKEAQKLVNIFELAKKKASAGDLSGLTCDGGFNGYQVNVTNSSYSLLLRCGGTSVSPAVFSYSFPNNISITSGSGDYYFRELNLKIELPANPIIIIKNSNISKCLDITISSSGIITLSDNFISC
jgi:type II secretory pathway pseudopilin PulG